MSIATSSFADRQFREILRRAVGPARGLALVGTLWAAFAPLAAGQVTFTGAQSTVPTSGLDTPSGVAVDVFGNVYVADQGNEDVVKIDPLGNQTTVSITLGTGLSDPTDVATDQAGDLFIVDSGNNRIVKVAAGGTETALGSGLNQPQSIAVDSSGNLFVADSNNSRVVKFTSAGVQSTFRTGISDPEGIAVDSSDHVYVAALGQTGIIKIAPGGGSQATIGSSLSNPLGVAVDATGTVYVAEASGAFQKITAGGAQSSLAVTGVVTPGFLAIDGDYDLFIPDSDSATVSEFSMRSVNLGYANACVNGNTSPCSQTATLNFTVTADTYDSSTAMTYGVGKGGDFGTVSHTCVGATSPCSVTVSFEPSQPGTRSGALLVLDGNTEIPISIPLYGFGLGAEGGFSPAASLAPVTSELLQDAAAVATDGGGVINGKIFIVDDASNQVWVTDGFNDYFNAVAGTGTPGYSGDGGAATAAELKVPVDIAIDGAGDLYIADYGNNVIRKVDTQGNISTVAGNHAMGVGFGGDGGPATSARLYDPSGVALDAAGNLYIGDQYNNRIRKVDLAGIITTVAGNGTAGYSGDGGPATSAEIHDPGGLSVDPKGDIFIADQGNNVVRKVDPTGIISTVAGNYALPIGDTGDGGPATSAELGVPYHVSVDAAGELFIVDHTSGVVRRVDAGGTISTYPTPSTQPSDVVVDPTGNLAVSDYSPAVFPVERIYAQDVDFGNQVTNTTSAPQDVTVTNIGNEELDFSEIEPDTGFNLNGPDTSCSTDSGLGVGLDCILGIEFDPPTATGFETAILLLDNGLGTAGSTPQSVGTLGTGLGPTATSTSLTAMPNPANAGQSVTLSASVTPAPTGSPLGTVSFCDVSTGPNDGRVQTRFAPGAQSSRRPLGSKGFSCEGAILGPVSIDSSGNASFVTSSLAAGSHMLTAIYSGNATFASSASTTVTEVINALSTATTLTAAPNPASTGQSVTLSATVSPAPTGSPLGSINFMDGETLLGTVNINSSGTASFSISILSAGSHTLTAVYSGNAVFATSTSSAVTEVIDATSTSTATTTTLTISPNPGYDGSTITLTATIAPAPTGSTLGTVTFCDAGGDSGPNIARRMNAKTANSPRTRASVAQPEISSSPCGSDAALGTENVNSQGVATLTLTTLTAGGHSIYAVYSGNSGFATSTSSGTSETVDSGYAVTAPPAVDVTEGGSADVTVTVPPLGGAFNSPVTLSASGLPPGAQATFNPPTVTPGASGEQTMMTIQLAKVSTAPPPSSSTRPGGNDWASGLAAALGLLLLGFAARRRRLAGLAAVLLAVSLISAAALLSGCNGGFAGLSTRPGQYTITITGTSGALHESTQVTVVVQ